MRALFWVSFGFVVYVYAGYPLLLAIAARLGARGVWREPVQPPAPGVSVVVAARNEAARLPSRIKNLLAQDYPGPLQLIVVSDGSTDGTAAALAPFADHVELVEIPASGKPSALNAGVALARHGIVVFADARQRFAPDAIRLLAENFADPLVGAATGELVLDVEAVASSVEADGIGEGVGLYWRYEKWLRRNESAVWSTLGATGAIYAIRRALWRPLPAATLLDDVLAPMRVVLGGARVVFDPRARAFDRAERDPADEWRRKVRTLAGNYQALALEPALLNPLVNPVWWQLISHKIARLVVPFAMVVVLALSLLLAPGGWLFTAALLAQLVFYALAGYGAWLNRRSRERTEATGIRAGMA